LTGEDSALAPVRDALAGRAEISHLEQVDGIEDAGTNRCDCVLFACGSPHESEKMASALRTTPKGLATVALLEPWDPAGAASMLAGGCHCCLPLCGADGDLLLAAIRQAVEHARGLLAREAALRRLARTERLAQLGSWDWDVDGDQTFWSPELFRLMDPMPSGVRKPVTWKHLRALLRPEDQEVADRETARSIATGERLAFEFRLEDQEGEIRWIESLGEVEADESGRSRWVQGIAQDITGRKHEQELEQQLHRTWALESVGELAGGIAHDFNNLLAVILNYASFVREELSDRPDLAGDLEEVERAATRGADLTRQLLVSSNRDMADAEAEAIDVSSVVAETETMLRRTLGEQVILATRADPGLAVCLVAGQLDQILLNLAINARDAMPEGGTLTLAGALIDAREAETSLSPGPYARFRVTDTGLGMTEETARKAFDPFFTTKPRGTGTGLGLATVYGIIQGAGGDLTLRSRPGQGTTVEFYLPTAEGAENVAAAEEKRARPAGQVVLVVEDDEHVRRVTTRILATHGYQVFDEEDPPTALGVLRRETVDLLVTDVVMKHSGVQLAREAREIRPEMPVLFISGYPETLVSHHDLAGDTVLLLKPFTSERLLGEVAGLLAT